LNIGSLESRLVASNIALSLSSILSKLLISASPYYSDYNTTYKYYGCPNYNRDNKMVRGYILTEREREMVKHYFQTGQKLASFYVLVHELKKTRPQIREDLELIDKLLQKES